MFSACRVQCVRNFVSDTCTETHQLKLHSLAVGTTFNHGFAGADAGSRDHRAEADCGSPGKEQASKPSTHCHRSSHQHPEHHRHRGYESDASPSTPHHRRGGAGGWSVHGGLEPLLLEANSVVTNPVFLEGDFPGLSVPATPNAPAPRLLQAVASQQVSLLHRPSHLERCMLPMCTTCSFGLHQHVLGACLQVTLAVICMRMLWLRNCC